MDLKPVSVGYMRKSDGRGSEWLFGPRYHRTVAVLECGRRGMEWAHSLSDTSRAHRTRYTNGFRPILNEGAAVLYQKFGRSCHF